MSDVLTIDAEKATRTTLTVIPASSLPTILAADKTDILGKLSSKVAVFRPDISTPKGRKEIASLAAEIASAKMDLIRLGKALTEEWRKQTKAVNKECGVVEDRMDALKEKVRAPLTAWENREKARVAGHETALRELAEYAGIPDGSPSDEVAAQLDALNAAPPRDWQEFIDRASDVYRETYERLRALHVAAVQREAEAEELAALRTAEAERQRLAAIQAQKDREAAIAAAAAEQARRAAEETAARKAQAAADAAAAQARRDAEAIAQAEYDRVAAVERAAAAERQAAVDKQVAADRLAKERADAAAREMEARKLADAAREAAEQQAARDRQAAIDAERHRVAAAAEEVKAEAARRAASIEHRRNINRLVLDAMVGVMLSAHHPLAEKDARAISKSLIEAIARGDIPNTAISY